MGLWHPAARYGRPLRCDGRRMGPQRPLYRDLRERLASHGACEHVFVTVISDHRGQLENGYAIWNFRGEEVEKHILDRFKQFIWRPRPRTLISKDQQRQIRKTLREYGRQFDEEDQAEASTASAELTAHRKRLVDEWNAWRLQCKEDLPKDRRGKAQAESKEEEKEEIEVWVEEVIEQVEEIAED
jgi:translation initiation factor 3 subunit B